MKALLIRILILTLVLALLMPVIAGCVNPDNTPDGGDDPAGDTPPGNNDGNDGGNEDIVDYTLTLSADKTDVKRGDTVTLSAVFKAEGEEDEAADEAEFKFVTGSEYATITDNKLTVKDIAPDGAIITVQAMDGASYSNTVTIKVSVPVSEIIISAKNNVEKPIKGQVIVLEKVVNPSGALADVSWAIIEGNCATLDDNVLTIKTDANVGDVVKVQASAGEGESKITSNVLTFTVRDDKVEIKITELVVSSTTTKLLAGQQAYISVTAKPDNATNTYSLAITAGNEYAGLDGNLLTVSTEAPTGATITVTATAGTVSNSITFEIIDNEKEVESIEFTSTALNPFAGEVIDLGKITHALPTDHTKELCWTVTEDGDLTYTELKGTLLVISANAPDNHKITVTASAGGVTTADALVITVRPAYERKPIEEITITAAADSIYAGESVELFSATVPAITTENVHFMIVGDTEDATINGNVLTIKEGVKGGTTFEVVGISESGNVTSVAITITVKLTQEEINETIYSIDLISGDSIELDKNGKGAAPVIEAIIRNGNDKIVSDKNVIFTISDESAKYLSITPSGTICNLQALGHGYAKVTVSIEGEDISKDIDVKVIVPPEQMILPDVFTTDGRQNIDYAFSYADTLPFTPVAYSSNPLACRDYVITFRHEDDTAGDEVATYNATTGEISFKKLGKVTVTATSNAGSDGEVSVSYTFDINDGYNVSTFAELRWLVKDKNYDGSKPINFVVLVKPVEDLDPDKETPYVYGYDIVPPAALLADADQTIDDVYGGARNRIQAVNKGLWINGNCHKIDSSQLRIFTHAEYGEYCKRVGQEFDASKDIGIIGSLLSAEPWFGKGSDGKSGAESADAADIINKTYTVKLYNIELKGNSGLNYNPGEQYFEEDTTSDANKNKDYAYGGAMGSGLNIGARTYNCKYHVDASNITVSGFKIGMNILGAVTLDGEISKISNIYAYNCYSTGVQLSSNIITLENMRFNTCGATGMELTAAEHNKAGVNDNESQVVTLMGTIDASFKNDGSTVYFQNYSMDIPGLMQYNMSRYQDKQNVLPHVMNANSEFIFVGLIFNDLTTLAENTSTIDYSGELDDGIIDIDELEGYLTANGITEDTTHKYIRLPIFHPTYGVQIGTALFRNQHYVAPVNE